MFKEIKFTTTLRAANDPIFRSKQRLSVKGKYQLSLKWNSTLYRVKKDDEQELCVYLDKSINGKRWALLVPPSDAEQEGTVGETFDSLNDAAVWVHNNPGSHDIINVR